MSRLAPRVKLNPDGTCTVSGIPIQDLRSIITAAQLNFYKTQAEFDARNEQGVMNLNWLKRSFWILERLDEEVKTRIRGTFPWSDRPVTKTARWEAVRDSQFIRKLLNRSLEELTGNN